MDNRELRSRLEENEETFKGLMSLVPADDYYGKDNSDQWSRKKQTKAEKRAARKAKLAPGANKSALDVHIENEKKRKRSNEPHSDADALTPKIDAFENQHGLAQPHEKKKKGSLNGRSRMAETTEKGSLHLNEQHMHESNEARLAKNYRQLADAKANDSAVDTAMAPGKNGDLASSDFVNSTTLDEFETSNLIDPVDKEDAHNSSDRALQVTEDGEALTSDLERKSIIRLPRVDTKMFQKRLADRIATLRAERNADGLDGRPARNRQELIEARRRKEEMRKASKKEAKLKARTAMNNGVNEEAARLRGGSSSPLEGMAAPLVSTDENFSFGRVDFQDGTRANPDLTGFQDDEKAKGASDPKTALLAAQSKEKRLAGLDSSKRAKIDTKNAWQSAEKRIAGEKIKDDTSLLKKTLKRSLQAKQKSGKAWKDREEGIRKSQEERQKKREENLKNRKSSKGSRYGLPMRRDTGKPQPKKKRPGFEGTFKAPSMKPPK